MKKVNCTTNMMGMYMWVRCMAIAFCESVSDIFSIPMVGNVIKETKNNDRKPFPDGESCGHCQGE